ncbi:tyrosine-type recombinase/integrase [Paenibacillus sp. IHBB 3054]|uniref:tyrosine-type recombinase/integrase n=1 Tax=Paenibacillus sp. IHBB 3054 TaxID=3425689 RepID=UPI003F6642B0
MPRKPKKPPEDIKYPGVRERGGVFRFRYDIINPETGKRKQKESDPFATALEAFTAGIKIKEELQNKTFVEKKLITFDDCCTDFLKSFSAKNKKGGTVTARTRYLKRARIHFKFIKIQDITKKQYQEFLNSLKFVIKKDGTIGLKENYIKSIQVSCKLVFNYAMENGIIKLNPSVGIEIPSYPKTVEELENEIEIPNYMEKEELVHFLRIIQEHGTEQEYHFFYVLAYTGLRIGELCPLKWRDLDKVKKHLSITKTLVEGTKTTDIVIETPKTKSSIRKISITTNVISKFDAQASWQRQYKMSTRIKYFEKSEFVFINTRTFPGYQITAGRMRSRMKDFLKLAGLSEDLSPHSLRHTHVSLLAEARIALEVIQERLGHKNDEITKAIYLHVTKKLKTEAPEKFEELLNGL